MANVVNSRDLALLALQPRLVATSVTIGGNGASFLRTKNGGPVTPTSINLTTSHTVFTNPTITWSYAKSTAPTTWTAYGTDATKNITNTTFISHLDDGQFVTYKVIATQTGFRESETTFIVTYSAEASEPIVITMSRSATNVPASNLGVVSVYTDTGTVISLKRGTTDLTYNTTGANTFSVGASPTINPVSKVTLGAHTGSGTTSSWANITAMATDTDSVTATFVVTPRDASGNSLASVNVVQTFTKVKAGSTGASGSGVEINLTRVAVTVPANSDGSSPVLTNTGTEISVKSNGSALTYSAAVVANTFVVSANGHTTVTPGTPTGTGVTRSYPDITAFTADSGQITFTITVRDALAAETSYTRVQSFSKAKAGTAGTAGKKSVTISAFRWLNSGLPTAPTQSTTYTWSSGTATPYPTSWDSAAGTAPGSGYVLYMLNLTIIDDTTATTTVTNWNLSTVGSIGYKQDGSIGFTGGSARRAYVVTNSASAPTVAPSSVSGDALPTTAVTGAYTGGSWTGGTWQAISYAVPAGSYYLWIADGIYNASTNTTSWATGAYQASLKVGNLQAISAELGVVQIATNGSLYSGRTTAEGTISAGFFLGDQSGTKKFSIGTANNAKGLLWDGTDLQLRMSGTAGIKLFNSVTSTVIGTINVDTILGRSALNLQSEIDYLAIRAKNTSGYGSSIFIVDPFASTNTAMWSTQPVVDGAAVTYRGNRTNNTYIATLAATPANTSNLYLQAGNYGQNGTVYIEGSAISLNAPLTSTSTGAFTSITVTSTSQVANLNASLLLGNTWASPGTIGGTTPAAITTTGLTVTTNGITINNASPGITFYESDRDFNLKRWLLVADGELFQLQTRTDADAQTNTPLIINRSGNMEVLGQVQSGSLRIQQTPTTGAHAANNSTGGAALVSKPGSAASNNTWMSLILNGTTYYIPVWT